MAMNVIPSLPENVVRAVELRAENFRSLPYEERRKYESTCLPGLQKDTPVPEAFIANWILRIVFPSWNSPGADKVVCVDQTVIRCVLKMARVKVANERGDHVNNEGENRRIRAYNREVWIPTTQQVLRDSNLVFIPFQHANSHWTLIIVYIKEHQIIHYNTQVHVTYPPTKEFPSYLYGDPLFSMLIDWYANNIGPARWFEDGWTHQSVQYVDQGNHTDSGLWVILTMRLAISHQAETNKIKLLAKEPYEIRKQQIEKLRILIGAELLAGEFLPQTTSKFPPLIRIPPTPDER